MKLGFIAIFVLVLGCITYFMLQRSRDGSDALGGAIAARGPDVGSSSTNLNPTTRSPSNRRSRQKLLSGKDKKFIISSELPEKAFNESLLELIRSTPSEQIEDLLNFVRNAQRSVGFPVSSSWIHYPAVRQPNEFFKLIENGQLTQNEVDIGIRSVSTLYPDLAFQKFEELALPEEAKKSLANYVVTSWMEQDSVAASTAVIDMGKRGSPYAKAAKLAVGAWLHAKGDEDAANLWTK